MIESLGIDQIGSLGFPVFVAVYLLWERGRSMKELTKAITDLRLIIEKRLIK
tara:strand:+ start:4445 stop:4600 length:156 start_codon:yes stop_codon:yes gene_type:complete